VNSQSTYKPSHTLSLNNECIEENLKTEQHYPQLEMAVKIYFGKTPNSLDSRLKDLGEGDPSDRRYVWAEGINTGISLIRPLFEARLYCEAGMFDPEEGRKLTPADVGEAIRSTKAQGFGERDYAVISIGAFNPRPYEEIKADKGIQALLSEAQGLQEKMRGPNGASSVEVSQFSRKAEQVLGPYFMDLPVN
jgi:predicted transcriptional regulator